MPPIAGRARLRQRRAPRDAGHRRAHAARRASCRRRGQINDLLTSDFFLPFANKAAHKEMREKARKLVFKYVNEHQDDLLRTWATERPFELYLDGVVVSGRADVIYDEHDGVPENLAIVDYKTSTGGAIEPLQLQVYADAGRREGSPSAAPSSTTWARRPATTSTSTTTRSQQAEATVIAAADGAAAARLHAEARAAASAAPATCGRVCGAAKLKLSGRIAILAASSACQNRRCASWPRPTTSGRPGACSALGT